MDRGLLKKIAVVLALSVQGAVSANLFAVGFSSDVAASASALYGPANTSTARLQYAMSRAPARCSDPAQSGSSDILRHLSSIRSAGLCYRPEVVEEGRFRWRYHLFHHPTERDGPFWLLPHDNENAAFAAAIYAVDTYGGGFLAIDSGQRRRFHGQDPNRNFSRSWSESMLCRYQARPAPVFTDTILAHFKRNGDFPYLALHNNGNRWFGSGGSGDLSVYRTTPVLKGFPSARASGGLRDEDNLVFIAGTRPYAADQEAQARVAALNRLGLNVVHKHVTARSFDCSLSDYLAWNRLGDYYNIEAQHGSLADQKKMVDRLMQHLRRRPLRVPGGFGGHFLGRLDALDGARG
jgi:hypothetical protein